MPSAPKTTKYTCIIITLVWLLFIVFALAVLKLLGGGMHMTSETYQSHKIHVAEWHQLTNPFDVPCRIVEVQYGDQCKEEDIERRP